MLGLAFIPILHGSLSGGLALAREPDILTLVGEVENSEFQENSETSENQFSEIFTPSFPFCTILKTENSELNTSEFSAKA